MKRIREALHLIIQKDLSCNQVSQALGVPRSTLQECLRRFESSGLLLEDALALKDDVLETRLYGPVTRRVRAGIEPDMAHILAEMKRPGVTLRLLWEEYRKACPTGLGYTQFWTRHKQHSTPRDLVMRQVHIPGEKLMVDYSGDRLSVVNPSTGEVVPKELFVAIWPLSNYVYAEAQDSQKLSDWSMGHVWTFEYCGCCPSVVVPDCLRRAVTKAHRYDPELNRTYVEMCTHYGVVAVPARAGQPRDKAKVEGAVRIVQQRIVAVLRNIVFHSLSELNRAVREEVERINSSPMKGYDRKTRRELFEEIDRPAAQPLPQGPWQYQQWSVRRVGLDYCVEVERHWYSVPYALSGRSLDVRMTATAVEACVDQQRVAVHARMHRPGGHSIQEAHMPESHRKSIPLSLEQLRWRAQHIGSAMQELVQARIDGVVHPVAALRACLGLIRYAENCHEKEAADRAARFALDRRMVSCTQYQQILLSGAAEVLPEEDPGVVLHGNLHGMSQWAQEG